MEKTWPYPIPWTPMTPLSPLSLPPSPDGISKQIGTRRDGGELWEILPKGINSLDF